MSRLEGFLAFVLLAGVVEGVVGVLWRIARWVWFYREALLTVCAVAFAIALVTLVPVMVAGGLASLAEREPRDSPAEEEDQWATPFRVSQSPGSVRPPSPPKGNDRG